MRSLRPKQPKPAVEVSWRSDVKPGFDTTLSDTDCFQQALREYRETSWDDSSFEELPFEAQQTILRRAQEIEGSYHVSGPHRFLMEPFDVGF